MLIIYFIAHQGDIPTSEAPKPSDSTFSSIYTVFFCIHRGKTLECNKCLNLKTLSRLKL